VYGTCSGVPAHSKTVGFEHLLHHGANPILTKITGDGQATDRQPCFSHRHLNKIRKDSTVNL
jgi:hypothetical protein